MMTNFFIAAAKTHKKQTFASTVAHLGALGLFALAIIDSSPIPTFSGPDILTAILAARHRAPWYEYAAVATAGSTIGAYFTFSIARKAGEANLQSKFGGRKLDSILKFFHRWGSGALAVSAAVPFPSPTSIFFAAAGASGYGTAEFLTVVGISRAVRYSFIAIVADIYGRRFIHALRHPGQYWQWVAGAGALIAVLIIAAIVVNRRITAVSSHSSSAAQPSAGTPIHGAAKSSLDLNTDKDKEKEDLIEIADGRP